MHTSNLVTLWRRSFFVPLCTMPAMEELKSHYLTPTELLLRWLGMPIAGKVLSSNIVPDLSNVYLAEGVYFPMYVYTQTFCGKLSKKSGGFDGPKRLGGPNINDLGFTHCNVFQESHHTMPLSQLYWTPFEMAWNAHCWPSPFIQHGTWPDVYLAEGTHFPMYTFKHLVESFPRRVEAVMVAKGWGDPILRSMVSPIAMYS